jgi:hypothetical protein
VSTYPASGLQRILVGSQAAVARTTFLDQDGQVAGAGGVVTADIARADGTSLAVGRATAAGPGVGACTVALTTSECATLDVLTITWKDGSAVRAVSYHRVVGGFLFSIQDLMQRDGMSTVGLPAAIVARDTVTDLFERETGVAWNPTYDLDDYSFCGPRRLILNHFPIRAIRSITTGGEAVSLTDLEFAAATGIITSYVGGSSYRTVVGYEHGFSAAPSDLREQALVAATDALSRQRSGLSDRTRQLQNEMGTISFSYAGAGHPTGIDSVDSALHRHDHRVCVA